jgi:hypothetical protein
MEEQADGDKEEVKAKGEDMKPNGGTDVGRGR